jgi:hypothetical protein
VDNGTNYTFFGASSAGLDFSVGGAGDYGAQQMVLKATGRLGINVTDPTELLDVAGTANVTTLSIGGTSVTSTPDELNLLDASTVTAPSEGIWTGVERVAVMNIGASEYAVGAHALGVTLPDNAIITRALLDITTPLTSSGGTTTLELATTGNIFPASLSLPIDFFLTLGGTVGIESFEEEMVYILTIEGGKLNGASTLTCTVAEEPVTAGSMNVYVYYVMGS